MTPGASNAFRTSDDARPAGTATPERLIIAERADVDLTIIAGAFARALAAGAPGLSETTRTAIVNSALIRLRHTLKPEKGRNHAGNAKG